MRRPYQPTNLCITPQTAYDALHMDGRQAHREDTRPTRLTNCRNSARVTLPTPWPDASETMSSAAALARCPKPRSPNACLSSLTLRQPSPSESKCLQDASQHFIHGV